VPGMTGPAIQSVIQTPHGEQCITTRGSEKQILSNLTNEFQEPTGELDVKVPKKLNITE